MRRYRWGASAYRWGDVTTCLLAHPVSYNRQLDQTSVVLLHLQYDRTFMKRPPWLDEQPEIVALLGELVDRLDRRDEDDASRLKPIRIDPKRFPGLFRHDAEADTSWILLRGLASGDGPLQIALDRKRSPYDAEFSGARVRLRCGAETVLRAWLRRPRTEDYREQWRVALARYADHFADGGAALASRPISLPEKQAEEVIAGFAAIADHADTGLTLRQLSARCFWGLSKFLDPREELVVQLFPRLRLAARPIIVVVHLPVTVRGVLFIENQDSYTGAIGADSTAGLALVYAAGFCGSANRIREEAGAVLHYHGNGDAAVRTAFETWWFSDKESNTPVWFWGDLDFAGMAILMALRERFGDVQAWQPGYRPMLQRLQRNEGHSAVLAGKNEQQDPGHTGCAWADRELLPAIRSVGRFVDQEVV